MIDLELSLTELAERLEIPGGEWLVDDVMRRVAEPAPRREPRRVLRLAGAMVLILVVVTIALPGPRRAVGRWLGFDSVRIEPSVTVPSTPEAAVTTTTPSTFEPALDLGPAVSITDAMERTGLPDPSPALLGAPLSVHVVQPPASGQIVVVYPPSELVPESSVIGAGALVSVMPARIEEGFFQKTLGATSTVRSVDVDGARGYWIEGSPHEVMFEFGNEVLPDTFRLATNTLLWQRGDHVYRLEVDTDLDTSLRIAQSVP